MSTQAFVMLMLLTILPLLFMGIGFYCGFNAGKNSQRAKK